MRKLVLLLVGVLLAICQLMAQQRTITGKVTDEKGAPIPGATIAVKGTNLATVAGPDGNFTISVPQNAKVLVVSSIGLGEKEIALTAVNDYSISLTTKTQDLREVVVVAYGERKRADLTGSVSTVKSADLENKPFTSVDKALQGQVAGLQSVASSGAPGAAQQIRIRGTSSITAGNEPLWVIDGVIVPTGDASRLTTTANLLSTLNPNDIESVSVLKDAASSSIYGARAANGVIIVTTKKGRSGKTKFRFDTELGQSDRAYTNNKYLPLNAAEYFSITREGLVNLGVTQTQIDATLASLGYNNGTDFNWYDAIQQQGRQQQYNISASGGNERTTFYTSGGYFQQHGSTINSSLSRYNGAVRIANKASDKLNFNLNLNGGFVRQRTPLAGGAFGNPVLSTLFLLPSRSAYNTDGSYNLSIGGLHNTIALSDWDIRRLKELSLRGSIAADYQIIKNLVLKTQFGMDYDVLEEDQYNNPFHGDGAASTGRAFSYYTRLSNWTWTNTLNYRRDILRNGDLKGDVTVGYEASQGRNYASSLQSQGFPPTLLLTWPSAGATPITASASLSESAFTSILSLGQLDYKSKYILSGSFRRDGSSRFGENNRYANFWSIGASWNIDKESFLNDLTFISQLKLRASYGTTGNAGIGNYTWRELYGYGFNYNQQPGSAPTNVGNVDLTWELNKPLNIGLDLGVLQNRLNLSFDWYDRKSEELLLDVPLSRTSGFASITKNVGSMQNTGFEFTLSGQPVVTKNFSWNSSLNFAKNKNKILSLPNDEDIPSGSFIIRKGESINSFYLRGYAGVDPANGDPLWYTNETRTATSNVWSTSERWIQGSSLPDIIGGFTNTFTFKGFSVEAHLVYQFGNMVQDPWGGYYVGAGFGATFNKVRRVLDRWQKPGDITDVPKYIYNGNKSFQSGSTFYLSEGDFIRLRNIQLGYDLPSTVLSKLKISNLFFYVRGTNLWTWVKDKNLPFDPEQGVASQQNLDVFIPKTITVGLNLGF
jgi:TonB-dependent starch-binding outer membrane protein SusC